MRTGNYTNQAFSLMAALLIVLLSTAAGAQQNATQQSPVPKQAPSEGISMRVSGVDQRVSNAVESVDGRITPIGEPSNPPAEPSSKPLKPASSWSPQPYSPTSGVSQTPQRSAATDPALKRNSPTVTLTQTPSQAKPDNSTHPASGQLANPHSRSVGSAPDYSLDHIIADSRATAARTQPKASQSSAGVPKTLSHQHSFAPKTADNSIASRHPSQHTTKSAHAAKKPSHGMSTHTSSQAKLHSKLTQQDTPHKSVK